MYKNCVIISIIIKQIMRNENYKWGKLRTDSDFLK